MNEKDEVAKVKGLIAARQHDQGGTSGGESTPTVDVTMADGTVEKRGLGLVDETPTEITTPETAEEIDAAAFLEGAAERRTEISEIGAKNQRMVDALQGVGIDPTGILLTVGLRVLVECVLGPEGSERRDDYDQRFELALAPELADLGAKVKGALMQRDAQIGQELLNKQPGPSGLVSAR